MKVLCIPLNAGGLSKKDGVEKAPAKIIQAADQLYLNESGYAPFIESAEVLLDNSNLQEAHEDIFRAVFNVDSFCMLLGGDHSMTYPAFKAFAKKYPGGGIIVLDAHPDCQDSQTPPTHEDYLRVLIDEKIVEKEKVVLFGIRNQSSQEASYLQANKILTYSAKEISFEGLRESADAMMSVARQWPALYLSIDIDVLDCAFAPGTGYGEPAGLTSRELIYLIQRLKMLKNLKMVDIVEVNPEKDSEEKTLKVAAKLLVELA